MNTVVKMIEGEIVRRRDTKFNKFNMVELVRRYCRYLNHLGLFVEAGYESAKSKPNSDYFFVIINTGDNCRKL